jgi:hypothetical protein
MSTVTADRVVANLVSTSVPGGDEPSVRLLGTRFENLRIAGVALNADLATDVFDKYPTHGELAKAYKSDDEVRHAIDRPAVRQAADGAPEEIRSRFRFLEPSGEMPARGGRTHTSLVRSLSPAAGGLTSLGHVIHVPGFAVIRLAEVIISRRTRLVSMLHLDFCCPYKGKLMFSEIADGGDGF